METVFSVCLGVALAAACGFRIFVPLLVMSLAARNGMLELAGGFDWIASTPALVILAVATVVEIAAYYVPWLDNALDVAAGPVAVVAGVVVAASAVGEMEPALRWSLAVIAGGGAAGAVQGITTLVRQGSTLTTGGLGNPLVSTVEAAGAAAVALLAVLAPVLAAALLATAIVLAVRWLQRRRRRSAARAAAELPPPEITGTRAGP